MRRLARPLGMKTSLSGSMYVGAGAVLGLAWGILMRGWMRFISSNPEFSWSGTLFILGASVIVGSVLGVARRRHSAGGVGWWRMSILALMLLGAGGALMWPSVITGGIAIGRPRPRWLRVGFSAIAIAFQVTVIRSVFDDNREMSDLAKAAAIGWYAPLIAFEAWAFSVVFAPSLAHAPAPGRVKRVLIAAPMIAVAAGAVVVVGLGG